MRAQGTIKGAVDTGGKSRLHNQASKVAEALSGFLATTQLLYQKSLFYHWNVTGSQFVSLHALFEQNYKELQLASDEIAERIRALGFFAPGTYREFIERSAIKEDTKLPGSSARMIENLLKDHRTAAHEAKQVLDKAEEAGDDVSVDLMVSRITLHDKTAWMLESLLQ